MFFIGKNTDERVIGSLADFKDAEGKVFVVPTNRKARRLKKELIAKGISSFYIETLSTLFEKLLSEIKHFQILDDAIAAYLLKRAAGSITPKFFTRFKGDTFPKGTLERIKNVISEYKRSGISPEILFREVEASGAEISELNKAEDIAAIYENYLKKAAELNALEIGDVYAELLNLPETLFRNAFAKVFPYAKTVFLQYFTEFTNSEIELLNKIRRCGVSVVIEFDYSENNPRLYEFAEKTAAKLEKADFTSIEKNESKRKANPVAEFLSENLFRFDAAKKKFRELTLFDGKDKFEEVENIAKIIKDLIVNENTEPSKIAVVFNLIGEYSPFVRTIFEEYGLPFNLSDRLTLDKSPAVKALLTFLEIKKNNFYYQTFFSAINNGYSKNVISNPYNLQRFAQSNSIIAGEKTWRAKLQEAESSAKSDVEKKQLEALRKDFESVAEILKPFNRKFTPETFLNEFKTFIKKLRIEKTLLEIESEKAEENITAVSKLIESFAAVCRLIEDELGKETLRDFLFYYDALFSTAQWARFNVKERSEYGVLVTSAEELRGLEFDYVFFGGLNDGILPVKYAPEIFFAKNFMAKEEEKLAEQRFIFYNVFNAFKKRMFVSYAKTDDKTELSRSVFLDDLLRIAEPREFENEYFDRRLYSLREKQIKFLELRDEFEKEDVEAIDSKIVSYSERKENTESVYNGFLQAEEDEAAKNYLENFTRRSFSVSQLESYALCPFKYFAERILKIEVLEDPEKEIEPILLGNYLHDVLYEFYTKLNEKGYDINSVAAEKLLFGIAERIFDDYGFGEDEYFYEKEKFFGIGGNAKDSILYHFLETERAREFYSPKFFEVSFGRKFNPDENRDKHLSVEFPFELEHVKIVGKIDRIDLSRNKFAVIDYKSGVKKVTLNSILNGSDLQLPIYALVAQELLGESYELASMAIYSLKFNSEKFGINEVKNRNKYLSGEELKELCDVAANFALEYHSAIASGIFTPTNDEKRESDVCRYCDFRALCRVDERED